MTRPAWPFAVAVIVVLTGALASCGGTDTDSGTPAAATTAQTPTATVTPAAIVRTPAATPAVPPTPTRTPVPGCAQGPSAPPATYYGFGLDTGDVVAAVNTRSGCEVVCEESEVDGDGFWIVRIAGDNVCGVREGDVIVFTINGEPTEKSEIWLAGGVAGDVANGISLR